MKPAVLVLPLCFLLAVGTAAAQQVYKWRDADGKLHFSDTSPPAHQAETLVVKPSMPANPAAGKGDDWKAQLEQSGVNRLQAQQKQAAADHAARVAANNCQAARRQLDILTSQRPVYDRGPDGQKRYLDDGDRSARTAAAQEKAEKYCR